jgi:hypothetical protein
MAGPCLLSVEQRVENPMPVRCVLQVFAFDAAQPELVDEKPDGVTFGSRFVNSLDGDYSARHFMPFRLSAVSNSGIARHSSVIGATVGFSRYVQTYCSDSIQMEKVRRRFPYAAVTLATISHHSPKSGSSSAHHMLVAARRSRRTTNRRR